MSVCRLGQLVRVLPRTTSASTSVHGPWQIAAIGLPASANDLHERDRGRLGPQLVRVGYAAGQHECRRSRRPRRRRRPGPGRTCPPSRWSPFIPARASFSGAISTGCAAGGLDRLPRAGQLDLLHAELATRNATRFPDRFGVVIASSLRSDVSRASYPPVPRGKPATGPGSGQRVDRPDRPGTPARDPVRLHPDDRAVRAAGTVRDAVAAEHAGFDFEVMQRPLLPLAGRAGPRAERLGRAGRGRAGDRARGADDVRDVPDHALPPGGRRPAGRDGRRCSATAGSRSGWARARTSTSTWSAAAGRRRTCGTRCSPRRWRSSASCSGAGTSTRRASTSGSTRRSCGTCRDRRVPVARRGLRRRSRSRRFAAARRRDDRRRARRPSSCGGSTRPAGGQAARDRPAADLLGFRPRRAPCERAHDQFRWFAGGWKVNAELPGPAAFAGARQFVRPTTWPRRSRAART